MFFTKRPRPTGCPVKEVERGQSGEATAWRGFACRADPAGTTLREVSLAARVSLGYLSEVERGQKEASSELLQSISQALGVPLSKVYAAVAQSFVEVESRREALAA